MTAIPAVQLDIAGRFLGDGLLREAEAAYQAVLAQDRENVQAWRGLGLIAERQDDLPTAIGRINEAMSRLSQQEGAEIAVDMARLLFKQGRIEETVTAGLWAAGGLTAGERWPEAIGILRQLQQLQPEHSEVRVLLVFALHSYALALQSADADTALSLELEALVLDPKQVAILREVIRIYSCKGDVDSARLYSDQLVQIFDEAAPKVGASKGLLDIALAEATAEEIAYALLSDGAVLLRGLLDDAAQRHYLSLVEKRWLNDPHDVMAHVPKKIIDAMAIIFGREPVAMTPGSNVRTAQVSDDQSFLFYHQDLTPLFVMGINFWAALDPIDGTRPGLEVLVRRQHKAFPVVPGHIIDSTPYRIPDELVRGVYPDDDFVAPQMAVGDGMLFLFSTVHRSHVLPGMIKARRNAELRFV